MSRSFSNFPRNKSEKVNLTKDTNTPKEIRVESTGKNIEPSSLEKRLDRLETKIDLLTKKIAETL